MKFNSSTGIIRLTSRGVRKQVKCVKTFYNEYTILKKLQDIPGVIKLLDANTDKGRTGPNVIHNFIPLVSSLV